MISYSDGDKNVVFVHVFSLRNNTWKTFENTNFFFVYESHWYTSCLNGNTHFGFYQLIRNPLDIINLTVTAAFEFEEDKFKLLTPPHDDNYEYRKASLFNPTLHTGTQWILDNERIRGESILD